MRFTPLRTLAAILLGQAVAVAAPAQQPSPAAPDAVLEQLNRCRGEADDRRLACYDAAADRLAAARRNGDILVLDRRKAERRAAVRFGLADPAPAAVRSEVEATAARDLAVRTLETSVRAVRPGTGRGAWFLTLANGQEWTTLAPAPEPLAGEKARITTTVTGGFRMAIGGRSPVQVRRTR